MIFFSGTCPETMLHILTIYKSDCKIALIIKYFKLMTYLGTLPLGTTLLQRFVSAAHTITTSSSIST